MNDEDVRKFPSKIAASAGGSAGGLQHDNFDASVDRFGSIIDGREFMAKIVLGAIMDYARIMEHGRRLRGLRPIHTRLWAKVKSRTGDLNAEGRGIDEFERKLPILLGKQEQESLVMLKRFG